MRPELYRKFYAMLEERDIILINSPEEYERYHLLPGWYDDFKSETAQSVWGDEGSVTKALRAARELEGPFIVKDYVKSRKHEWYDACYIENIANVENASKIITNFVDRQREDLIGGIVLRRFVKLKQIGYHENSGMPLSEEYRVFIVSGRVAAISDYWRGDEEIRLSDAEREWIGSLALRVKSNFVTMDLARKEDGSLIIIEFGDGQVSGLQQIDPGEFYSALD